MFNKNKKPLEINKPTETIPELSLAEGPALPPLGKDTKAFEREDQDKMNSASAEELAGNIAVKQATTLPETVPQTTTTVTTPPETMPPTTPPETFSRKNEITAPPKDSVPVSTLPPGWN